MSLTMGLFLLMILTTNLGGFLQGLFAQAISFVDELIHALRTNTSDLKAPT